jgi:hypothetical protein
MKMGGLIGVIVGLAVGGYGFLVMRNPMRLALLSPWALGYYQRLVLDIWQRILMRIFGAVISLFGLVILTAALGGLVKLRFLDGASNGLLALMWLLFIGAWVFGLVYTVIQLIRGRFTGWVNWLAMWKQGVELGPITVSPPITSAIQQESLIFTVGFCVFVAVAMVAGPYLPV